ncbi:MAG: iron ABC transporter permease [Myxococcota bacterium]
MRTLMRRPRSLVGRGQALGWRSASLLISLVIAVPMVAILLSLLESDAKEWTHIQQVLLPEYLKNTFLLMVQVAAYTTVIGVGTAWLTVATSFPGRRWLTWALTLPLATPAYITAYVYTDLLEYSGPVQTGLRDGLGLDLDALGLFEIRSLPGAAFVIGLSLYPYVYLLARVAFLQRSARLFDAARTLGASPWRAFFRIALPAAWASIAGGLSLVLMETLADFGVVEYFGIPTFSTGIFRTWFASGERIAAMKLAAVMFIVVIVLVAIEKQSRRSGSPSSLSTEGSFKPAALRGWRALVAAAACLLPVVLGALIPLLVLLRLAITEGDPMLGPAFLEFMKNSVWVALLASLISVLVALVLTYAQHLAAHWTTSTAVQISTLGYALPGTMLAVGLLQPLSLLDHRLALFFDTQLNWRPGLILTGTLVVLIYAYVTRFLTVAYNATSSSMDRIPQTYLQAARSLGAGPMTVIRRIQLPLMRRAIMTAALVVFVDTIKELPATLLLRPFNFETLATRVYRLAGDERLAEASTAALTIVLLGLIPVLLLNRQSK